jgi:choline dehydrogenase-like flavoprotein
MLSGIGPRQELARHGIAVRVDLPGVGTNLQDRYEIGVVNRMREDWQCMAGAHFATGDSQYQQWAARRKGIYTTNGGLLGVINKSDTAPLLPDLFFLALMGQFRGYFPGYDSQAPQLPHLGRLEGPYPQHGWHRDLTLG